MRPVPWIPGRGERGHIAYGGAMLPPGLSMLWEDSDPAAALRERFGFRDLAEAITWMREALAEHWGIALRGCSRLVISDRNAIAWLGTDAGALVLKVSSARARFAELAAATRLAQDLDALGVPLAAPLPARDGAVRRELDAPAGPLSLALLPEVDGDWLEVGDLTAVRSAGRALAAVHEALRVVQERETMPPADGDAPEPVADTSGASQRADAGDATSVGDGSGARPSAGNASPVADGSGARRQAEEPTDRIRRWLADSDRGLVPAASARLARLLEQAPPLDQAPQLVHHDFRAANILVRDSAVVAVLDFDEVEPAHRVDDLARASVYLATRFRDWGPTPPAARRALREGYEDLLPLGDAEQARLELLTLWYGLAAVPPGSAGEAWAAALDI